MAYKTILLCLNEIARLPQIIEAGRTLGTEFKAHISGLYVIPGIQVYPTAGYAATPDIFDGNRAFYKNHQTKVREAFEKAMQADGLSFDFQLIDSSTPLIGNEVMVQGRNADLIVVSSTDRDSTQGVEYDFVERLIIAAGRPVMILPFVGSAKLNFNEVMVAWDDSREAARAAFDALPLMQKSKRTRVVSIDTAGKGKLPGGTLAESLDRHGVKVELTSLTSDGQNTGETLLRAASDFGTDIIVLGGYGHSRFTEFIFGGVTRHMIRHLDRPIVMSH
jgi:nucleotide-binding universal stress UspA family protein